MNRITIGVESGLYAVRCVDEEGKPVKDLDLVDSLKTRIPKMYRRWEPTALAWLVDPKAKNHLTRAIDLAGYAVPEFPPLTNQAIAATVRRTLRVEYLGQCKEREDRNISALATLNAQNPWMDYKQNRPQYDWKIEFPEEVLKEFFNGAPGKTAKGQTFYQVLCVVETATADQIKSAYRRLSLQWHPDRCKEEDATDKFMEINEAHDVLRDPMKRKRYDVGLSFERESAQQAEQSKQADALPWHWNMRGCRRSNPIGPQHYRAPFRCGVVVVEGQQGMKRFKVTKIVSWDDITDATTGRVMSTSWNKSTNSINVEWI